MSSWFPKDDQSTKPWGTPRLPVSIYASSTATWGTLPTTTSSTSSLQAVIDHDTSWSPPNNIVAGSSRGSSNASPSLYPSVGTSPSVAGSYGYLSPPPPPPVSSPVGTSSWTQLNPLLDSRSPQCLNFDIGALQLQYMPNMNGPAAHPPVTFMQLLIILPPFKWHVNISVHGPLSVSQVVQQLFDFLQGYQSPQDLQKYKVTPSSGYNNHSQFREQNHPNGFHSGQRRIDLLGRHRIFRGLSPEPGPTRAWVVHLSDRQ